MKNFLFTILMLFLPIFGFGQLLSEGFDDITTLPGAGWTLTNQSNPIGINDWFQGNDTVFPSHSGSSTSYIAANFNSTSGSGTISTWLITPVLNVKDGDKISFWTRTATGSIWNDRLEVRMSQGTMTLPSGASGVGSFTTTLLIINDGYDLSYPEIWTKFEVSVSGVGSTPTAANFAFRYNVVNGGPSGTDSNYIGIDDVLVEEGGGCTPTIEVNQDQTNACMANISQFGLAQSYKPLFANSAGAGIRFEDVPTSGLNFTLSLWDNLPNAGGNMLVTKTVQTDGSDNWVDVIWDSPVAVTIGNTYYIVIDGDLSLPCISGSLNNPYPDGMVYANAYGPFPSYDYTFRTYGCGEGGGGETTACLSTLLAGGNNGSTGGAVYFDVVVGADDIQFTGLDLNTDNAGNSFTVDVYTHEGTYAGTEGNAGAWTLMTSGTGTSNGTGVASHVDVDTPFDMTAGTTYAVALVMSASNSHYYTNGDGSNQTYTDGTITLNLGSASNVPFDGVPFSPRVFNGAVCYSTEGGGPDPSECPIEYTGDFIDGLGNLAGGVILASDFPVPAGEIWNVDTAKVQLLYETTSVEVSFYEDAGGQPGAQVFAPTVVTPVSQDVIGNASGTDVHEVILDLSAFDINLDGGSSGALYWMAVQTTAPDGLSYWHYTETVNNGTNFWVSLDSYATWEDASVYGFFVDGAFSICTGGITPPGGGCEQDLYTTEEPISGAGYSGGNWVANDVIVEGGTHFMMQSMIFETVNLSGDPTEFDLEIFNDDGSGGVGTSTGMTYHFDSSNMTWVPNGLLFGAYPQFTVTFDLPDIVLQSNGSADTRYWLAVSSELSTTSDYAYWVSYLHSATPIPESNPTWQLLSGGSWALYDSGGPNEGYMKVVGECETLGVNNIETYEFAYYPNPVKDVLNIKSQKPVKSVEVFNMAGQKVMSTASLTNGQVHMNALNPGVYIFKVILEGNKVETFKIIKK